MIIVGILLAILACLISFGITSGVIWLICWAFGLAFTWKVAFGVWLVLVLVSGFLKNSGSN